MQSLADAQRKLRSARWRQPATTYLNVIELSARGGFAPRPRFFIRQEFVPAELAALFSSVRLSPDTYGNYSSSRYASPRGDQQRSNPLVTRTSRRGDCTNGVALLLVEVELRQHWAVFDFHHEAINVHRVRHICSWFPSETCRVDVGWSKSRRQESA